MRQPATRTRNKSFYSYKEERWLNDMAARGWYLTYVSPVWGHYRFVAGEPGGAVRMDYRRFASDDDLADYGSLCADAGWSLVRNKLHGSGYLARIFPQQYLVRRRADADDDIFSDDPSRALSHLQATRWAFGSLIVSLVLLLAPCWAWAGFATSPHEWRIWDGVVLVLLTVYLAGFAGSLARRALFHWRMYRRLSDPSPTCYLPEGMPAVPVPDSGE